MCGGSTLDFVSGRFHLEGENGTEKRPYLYLHWQNGTVGALVGWERCESRGSRTLLREAGVKSPVDSLRGRFKRAVWDARFFFKLLGRFEMRLPWAGQSFS